MEAIIKEMFDAISDAIDLIAQNDETEGNSTLIDEADVRLRDAYEKVAELMPVLGEEDINRRARRGV